MDLKQAIASGIQDTLLRGVPLDKSEPIEEMEGPDYGLLVEPTGPLETMIRARTAKGIRYFTVKITENI